LFLVRAKKDAHPPAGRRRRQAVGHIAVVAAVVDKTLRYSLFIRRIQNPPADPADTTALEREIDQLVYAVYGLGGEKGTGCFNFRFTP
jgi:hypothetical protein